MSNSTRRWSFQLLCVVMLSSAAAGQSIEEARSIDTTAGDQMIGRYFAAETSRLTDRVLGEIETLSQWQDRKPELRRQLLEMLGLQPMPERSELNVTVTGEKVRDDIRVKSLHFQSLPGLYVTANLYTPAEVNERLPAILYVCGHAKVEKEGISYGNKVHYHHHGSWFARNGYACLTIDTLQLGEIEGIHHGTYREKMWWWLNRGYTPAGVEAWNCIRAVDYLQSLPDVDPDRIGVTGRSGGGAYSWWIAATDERIKCAVPVAGITDLQNHVVDGVVEGHCDCMFMFNTHQWDYPVVAALVAPRPLLISNTDRDSIFPLDGVYRTFTKVRKIYDLHGASENVALHITAGPHKDTQELRIHAFRWFNHYLKHDDSLVTVAADKQFEPDDLKVFQTLPTDEINTRVQESFIPVAQPTLPKNASDWKKMARDWQDDLLSRTFAAWPRDETPPELQPVFRCASDDVEIQALDFSVQPEITLRLFVLSRKGSSATRIVELRPVGSDDWDQFAANVNAAFSQQIAEPLPQSDLEVVAEPMPAAAEGTAIVWVAPRGIGPTIWNQSEKKQTQIRRRFYLLGQTLDGMRVYDVRRAVQAIRTIPLFAESKVRIRARGNMGAIATYAAMFEPSVTELRLSELPNTHRNGPYLLNVRRVFDMPQALAVAATKTQTSISSNDPKNWQYTLEALETAGKSIEFSP